MKYSRAALRRGAPRPQNAEARGRQARAAADKAGPRRDIGGQKSPSPRHGGQGRPAPRHRRTRQARAAASADKAGPRREAPQLPRLGHMRIISHLLHFVKPLFLVLFPALCPTFSVPLWLSPPFCGFLRPVFPSPRRNGARRASTPPGAERGKYCKESAIGLPCKASAASDLSRPAAARGADSVPKQTRKKPRRRGTGRTVGNTRRGNNAAARRSDAASPPLLPQSAGAQTRRAGAYT